MSKLNHAAFFTLLLLGTFFAAAPTTIAYSRVGSLTFNTGEGTAYPNAGRGSAVIDQAGGFAYFGTNDSPGKVVKIRLSNFTRVGALTLNTGENDLYAAAIDTSTGFAYFVASGTTLVKVRLSDFSRLSALTVSSFVTTAIIDSAHGYLYLGGVNGTNFNDGLVVKVRLSDFTQVGTINVSACPQFPCGLSSAVIDTTNGFAYFGTYTDPGAVVKIRLSTFTYVSTLYLNAGENTPPSAVIDTAAGYAYFGTTGFAVKIRLSDFTRIGALNTGTFLTAAVIDTIGAYAYFGAANFPSIIYRIRLSNFTLNNNIALTTGENYTMSAAIDPTGGYAYFGTYTNPERVVKIQIASSPAAPQNLQAIGSSGHVTLTWTPPSSNGDRNITGYKIYRSTVPGGEAFLTSITNQTTYTDTAVTSNTNYYYKVTALSSFGESPQSNEATTATGSATYTLPAPPLSLLATLLASAVLILKRRKV